MGQARRKAAYFAELAENFRRLSTDDAGAAARLHEQFLARLFCDDEEAHFAFREAMRHESVEVRAGLAKYLDAFFSYGWFVEPNSPPTLVLAQLWEVRTRQQDVVADLTSTEQLSSIVAGALGLAPEQVQLMPQLSDVSAFDGFDALANWVSRAKTTAPMRDSFRFGEDAGPGVYRLTLARVAFSSETELQQLAYRIQGGLPVAISSVAEAQYTVADLQGVKATGTAYLTLTALGFPFTLARDATFHEARESWRRWSQVARTKGIEIENVAVNIVVSDQQPIALPPGALPVDGQELPDPQVALIIGDKASQKALDALLFYEGPHALLAIPEAADLLASEGVGQVFIGGAPIKP